MAQEQRATPGERASQSGDALTRAVASIRRTAPTERNAHRLWCRYAQVLKDDQALTELVAGVPTAQSIDGMTEVLSPGDLFQILGRPDCLAFELPSANSADAPPRAFLIVPFARNSPDSIAAFRDYFLSSVFDSRGLKFAAPDDEREFHEALGRGNLGYLSEFVSPDSSAATIALLIAAYNVIVSSIFGGTNCVLLGKCLEAVRIGSRRNEIGNQPIKRLAESFGVRKIGEAAQRRELLLPPRSDAQAPGFVLDSVAGAELIFGLYMGSTETLAPLARLYAGDLHESLRSPNS